MQRRYLILILMLITALAGFSASAQVRDGDIVLNLSPQYPNPNQNVTAILSSYATNLDKAYIAWSINNMEMSKGIGKKVFLFTVGNLGSLINLTATINTVDGQNINKIITIIPTNVDMLWEAYDSYTPPFYKGKTLAGSQGSFKVVAIPNLANQSEQINTNNLSYVWTKDGDIQPDSSGWGKNYFTFKNSYLDKENIIEVKVSGIVGNTNSSGTIKLQTAKPEIIFYANDPLLGVKWERTLVDGFKINKDGETFVAEPYFFSPQDINSPNLVFDWFINGEKIQTSDSKNILSIKPESGQAGSAIIKIIVNNTKTLFQSVTKQISVNF